MAYKSKYMQELKKQEKTPADNTGTPRYKSKYMQGIAQKDTQAQNSAVAPAPMRSPTDRSRTDTGTESRMVRADAAPNNRKWYEQAQSERDRLMDELEQSREKYTTDYDKVTNYRSWGLTPTQATELQNSLEDTLAEQERIQKRIDEVNRRLETAKTQSWEVERKNSIQAAGGDELMNQLLELARLKNTASLEQKMVQNPQAAFALHATSPIQEEYRALRRKLEDQYGDALNDWLEYAQRVYDQQTYADTVENVTKEIQDSGWNAAAASALSVPLNVLGGGAAYFDVVRQRAANMLLGKDTPINLYSQQAAGGLLGQDIRTAVAGEIEKNTEGKVGSDTAFGNLYSSAYQLGMSMADSGLVYGLTLLGIPSAAGTALLGGSAATSTMRDAINRGATQDQAMLMGAVSGLAEMFFEKYSIENLIHMNSPKTLGQLLKSLAIQGGIEASEEGATTLANTAADLLIMGDKSQLQQSVQAYKAQGYSTEEAERLAAKEWVLGLTSDMVGGFISGGIFGGVGGTANYIANRNSQNGVVETGQTAAQPVQQTQAPVTGEAAAPEAKPAQATAQSVWNQSAVKTFGETGAKAFQAVNDGSMDGGALFAGFAVYHKAGMDGKSIKKVKGELARAIPENIRQIAYDAGVKDAELAKNAAEGIENPAAQTYTDSKKMTEVPNNGDEVHLRNSGQWPGSQNPGGQVSAVEEGAGRDQNWQAESESADGGAASLSYGQKVSTASLGIRNGSTEANIRIVTGGETAATRAAMKTAKANGLQLTLFVGGNLQIGNESGKTDSVRAYISGKKVYVRADHPVYTADQLMRHEAGHAKIARGEIDPQTVRERIDRQYGAERIDYLSELYADAYEGTGLSADEVWEEVICDSLGDMNIFQEYKVGETAGEILRDVKESAETETQTARGPPATDTNSGGKMSREYWRPDLTKAQLQELVRWVKRDIRTSENSICETANWTFHEFNGLPVFAVYDTTNPADPTILYESKGKRAKIERDYLVDYLEEFDYGESANGKSSAIDAISGRSWMREVSGTLDSDRVAERERGSGDAGVLRKQSRRDPSPAFESVLRNLFQNQEVGTTRKFSRELDAKYMAAVESGDMETAQRMVDEAAKKAGYTVRAYHGTGRADRVGTVFRPDRATSGPMAFFTSDPNIAANYAKDKADTSLAYDEEYADYYSQFRVNKNGKSIKVQDLWRTLPFSEKQRLKEAGKHITWDDDMENIVWDDDATRGLGNWDAYTLNEHKGNAIEALIDCWLESGELYGNEGDFVKVLELAGIKGVEYRDPDVRHEKVYDTYLKIANPFNTASVDESFATGFEEWYDQQPEGKYDRETAGADMWDKNSQTAERFLERVRDDIAKGTSYAWTSIPDSVTDYLKHLGHDGIQDVGGKNGGDTHTVWIPFSSEQVKSAEPVTYDDNGNVIPLSERFDAKKVDIRYSRELEKQTDELMIRQRDLSNSIYPDLEDFFDARGINHPERFAEEYLGLPYDSEKIPLYNKHYKFPPALREQLDTYFDLDRQLKDLARQSRYDEQSKSYLPFVDSEDQQLSPEQRYYFRNSKVLDKNGRLLKLYHGTGAFGFTKLDFSKSDDGISFFMTDSQSMARSYSGTPVSRSVVNAEAAFDAFTAPIEDVLKRYNWLTDSNVRMLTKEQQIARAEKHRDWTRRSAARLLSIFDKDYQFDAGENELFKDFTDELHKIIRLYREPVSAANTAETAEEMRRAAKLLEETADRESVGIYHSRNPLVSAISSHLRPYDMAQSLIEAAKALEAAEAGELLFLENGDYAISEQHLRQRLDDEYKYSDGEAGNYELYANLTNPLIINANGANWETIRVPKNIREEFDRERGTDGYAMTRQFAAYAKAHGYDGVIFNDLFDSGPEDYTDEEATVVVAFDSNQVKDAYNLNPTSDPDIRFSRELESMEELRKQHQTLRRQLEYWKSQVKPTNGFKVNSKDVEKLAKKLIRTYKVDTDADDFTKKLQTLYDGIAHGYYGNVEIDYETAKARAGEIARTIVENAVETDNELYVEYAELRKYLRGITLNISAEDSRDIPDFNDFRKRNMGRMRIGTKGTNIDSVYKELSRLWPEFFDETRETTPSDQLLRIAEVMEGVYRTYEVNPFGRYAEEAVSDIADEVLAYFFTLPQAQTYADKAAAKLKQSTADARLAGQMAQGRQDAAKLRQTNDQIDRLKVQLKQAKADASKLKQTATKDAPKLQKANEKVAALEAKLKQATADAYLAGQMVQGKRDAALLRRSEDLAAKAHDRAMAALEKEKQRGAAAVQKLKDTQAAKTAKTREQRMAAELRGKIIRHSKDMSQKLLRPTDKKHIPEELQSAVAAVLEAINLESNYEVEFGTDAKFHRVKPGESPYSEATTRTKAFRQLREAYKKVAGEVVVDPALFSTDGDKAAAGPLLEAVLDMGDIRIADMNSEQLSVVWQVLRAVEQSVRSANKLFLSAKYETISEMASQLQSDSVFRRPKKAVKAPKWLGGSGNLTLDLEIPLTFFSKYGEVGQAIYKELRDAQDYQERLTDGLAEEVGKIVKPKQVQEMQKEVHTFKTEDGDELKLTTAHIMELYELSKRKQAEDHLLKGGIVQPEIQSAKIDRGTDMIKLTATDLGEIISKLTAEQKRIADALQKLLTTTLADAGNRASMQAYGYKKFTGTDYWPIKSAQEALHHKVEKGANNTRSIKNIGLAQQVVPHANTALNLGGIFQTFAGHATDMIDYAAWLCPMEDANRLFNYKYKDSQSVPTGRTVKGILDKVGGSGSQTYWSNLMEDIQNGIGGPGDSAFAGIAARITGNVKGASVGANIRVIVQQPTAIVRAATVLSPGNMLKGIAKGVTKGGGWKKALAHSDIAKRKDRGGFEIGNQMQMSEILFDDRTRLARFNDTMSWGAAKADAITWGRIWNACEWQVHGQNKALQPGSEAFYQKTAELFADVINESQVVDGVMQRSQIMRSSNQISKQMTSFMGEPTMSLNMLMRAWDALRYEQDPPKRGKAMKQAARVAAALLVTDIITALAQALVDGLRDDDRDKKYKERVWSAFTGISGEEESAWDKAVAVVLSGNLVGTMNPVGRLPYAKDLLSLIQGYSVERMDISAFADLISAGSTFIDSLNGDGTKTWAYATKQLATAGSKVVGISAANILRDVWSVARSIAIETGSYELQYEMEKAIYKIGNEKNDSRYIDLLYDAMNNDEVAYRAIYADMIKNGMSALKISQGIEKRMKKDQGVESVEDLTSRYLTPDQKTEYDKAYGRVAGTQVWKSATEEQREKLEDNLYDLTVGNGAGEDLREKIEPGKEVGIDEVEYLLYKLAQEVVSEDGNKNTNQSEAEAAAELLTGLSKEEQAWLWQSTNKGWKPKNNPFN